MLIEYICHTNEIMHSKTLKIKPQVMESERCLGKRREIKLEMQFLK
jgi:hypothetical protein